MFSGLQDRSYVRAAVAGFMTLVIMAPAGCVSSRTLTAVRAQKKLSRIGSVLLNDPGSKSRLSTMREGKTGFFYLLDREGIVLAHPVNALVGRSFSDYPFMEGIRERGSGCLKHSFENGGNLLFFRTLENGWILCMSVMAEEIHGPVPGCKPIKAE